jgi:Calx-beta domain/FG-GAP-like repeat
MQGFVLSKQFVRRTRWLFALSSCALLAAIWQGGAFDALVTDESANQATAADPARSLFGASSKSGTSAAVLPAYSLTEAWSSGPSGAVAIAKGDFNGDGRDDLAAVGGVIDSLGSLVNVSFYLQQVNGVLGAPTTQALPMELEHFKVLGLAATDLNEDGRSDLILTIRDRSGMHYLLSQPGGGFSWRLDAWSALQPTTRAHVADMDGDGHSDFIVPLTDPDATPFSGNSGLLAAYFGDGLGNFPRHGFELTSDVIRSSAVGQLNGDSLPDVLSLASNPYEQPTSLRLATGNGTFADVLPLDARWPEEFLEVTSADLFGGARADSVGLARGDTQFPRFVIYPQLANGQLATQPVQYGAADYAPVLRHADLDGDGDMDLLQAGQGRTTSQFYYYLQDEYGLSYGRAVLFDLSASLNQWEMRDLVTGDFNNDGVTDVVVASMSHGVIMAAGKLTPFAGTGSVPGPPGIGLLDPTESDSDFRWVKVTVTPPLDDGGNPITGYTVYSIPGGGRDLDAGSNAAIHQMAGLDNHQIYTFYARASNAAGMGLASTQSPPLVLGTPVDPNTAPVVHGNAGSYGYEPDTGLRYVRAIIVLDKLAPAGGVSVDITPVEGTALAGSDFVATGPVTVTVPAGEYFVFADILMLVGDMVPEETESFSFHLSNPQGATIGESDFTITVFDNDIDDSPKIVIGGATVTEGNSGSQVVNLPILLNKALSNDVVFDIEEAGGYGADVGEDFDPVHFVGLRIAAGQTSITVPVTIRGDTDYESDEMVGVYLANLQGAVEGLSDGLLVIKNDDTPPSFSIADASVAEGDVVGGVATFTVSLSGKSSSDAYFTVATAAGTAKAGVDMQPDYLSGLFIPKGQTSVQVSTPVIADTLYELDDTFTATLQDTGTYAVLDGVAVGTIVNDDAPPIFTVSNVGVTEGGTAQFTISLSKVIGMDATFDLSVDPGTAQPGSDYSPPAAQAVMIPEGTTTRTLDVPTVADSAVEMNETFAVNASHIIGAADVHAQGRGTIVNDDLAGIYISDATLVEGNSGNTSAVFEIRLTAPMPTQVSLAVGAVAGGTAQAGVDYLSLPPEARTIDAGRSRIVFSVPVVGDTAVEGSETFVVKLSGVSGAMVADDTGIGTIMNDDAAGVRARAAKASGVVPSRSPLLPRANPDRFQPPTP